MKRTKPTRRDLLIVIGRLQGLLGRAMTHAYDDRNPNQLTELTKAIEEANTLAFDALQFDPPMDFKKSKNNWHI